MATALGYVLNPPPEGMRVMGPAEAAVPRVKNEYRYQLLMKAAKRATIRKAVEQLRAYALEQKWPATALVLDVDPQSLM